MIEATSAALANEGASTKVVNGERADSMEPLSWDDRLYEIVNGERVEKLMGFRECLIASDLGSDLSHYARTGQLGRVCIEAMFCLDAAHALERRPDVAFVSYQRWPKKRRLPRTNAAPVVPDLAVEVVSPTNLGHDVLI